MRAQSFEVLDFDSSVARDRSNRKTNESVLRGARPHAAGKFLFTGDDKLFVRGVTYGTFRDTPGSDGLPPPTVARADLAAMAASGLNSVRLYTTPPRWFLDEAAEAGLRVLAGVPWEQHVAFLDDRARARSIRRRMRAAVRSCAGHPAILGYAIGNEIPPSIVRWVGSRPVERHLRQLAEIAHEEDPQGLVTYGNFPSTEYLELPFLDFVCFNVYLEETDRFERYLARLQHLAGERPLVIGELGLDSQRNGEAAQAWLIDTQLRASFAAGCAGAFVYAWTDEWHRGGAPVEGWDFGLTRRDRSPKLALSVVRGALAELPFGRASALPRVSVVVCVKDGEATIEECLRGVADLDYPDYETLVIDDGSTDRTAEIASRFPVRLIRTENRGLSAARNRGIELSTGEIVAYIDADAWPDPHWLRYIVEKLRDRRYAGAGGPNLACPEDGDVADCVANAPGRPMHVLISDRVAEHLPGCNMAFRRAALQAVGGFDEVYRVAGDDVDLCWRLQERGMKLAFAPAAVVWHHLRDSLAGYLRQQRGYGRAEALLEQRWPSKYNPIGQVAWSGRIYSQPQHLDWVATRRIYHGIWGTAAFQPRQARPSLLLSVGAAPEWYLILVTLAALSFVGLVWRPLLVAIPLLVATAAVAVASAARGAMLARFARTPRSRLARLRKRLLTALLHLEQPAARLEGRLRNGLTPWRGPRRFRLALPLSRQARLWTERRREPSEWLEDLERRLRLRQAVVLRGGPYDRWDLAVRAGACGTVRLRMGVEEHGDGRQLLRFRIWPWLFAARFMSVLFLGSAALAAAAALDGAWIAAGVLGAATAGMALRIARQSAAATGVVLEELKAVDETTTVILDPGDGRGSWRRRRAPSLAQEAGQA